MLAALAGAAVLPFTRAARANTAPSSLPDPRGAGVASARKITDMIGTNGWATSPSDLEMWRTMGLTWGRGSVGPGQPDSRAEPLRVDETGTQFDSNLPSVVIRNNRNGIGSLLLLGYTPRWNASVPGDSNSAPVDVQVWERYVDAVVRKYSAPPYNLRYFQIWNEAAGKLSGGMPQATFWHGPDFDKDDKRSKPYERAMQDYVEKIHIPAAKIIRRYHAFVVYGGWPDQGGLANFSKWLQYRSPVLNERMLDWVDYLDTHYLNVDDFDTLYEQYVRNGPARGIWQTEIGDEYMKDPHYLPKYFFRFATWALDRNWNDPDKYLSMVYHWDGYEPFRLTHRGPPERTYNVSGKSLIVLRQTVDGSLASFSGPLQFGPGATGIALRSGNDVVMQVNAESGWRTVTASGLKAPGSRATRVEWIDALSGVAASPDDVTSRWEGEMLTIRFRVPDRVNGTNDTKDTKDTNGTNDGKGNGNAAPKHLAYLVVRA